MIAVPALQVSSSGFEPNQTVPRKFTCEGSDVSPFLRWSAGPEGTKTYALIVEDPDAPGGTFIHWVLYDYAFNPGVTRSMPVPGLSEGVPKTPKVALESLSIAGRPTGELRQGKNDFDHVGYSGPCPPPGKPHHYEFHVFALDRVLGLAPGASAAELRKAMEGHILAEGKLVGLFGR